MPEMEAPAKIEPRSPGDYLEFMSKVVFRSGMSYKIIDSKCRASGRHSTASTQPRLPA